MNDVNGSSTLSTGNLGISNTDKQVGVVNASWWRRNRRLLVLLGILMMSVILFVGVGIWKFKFLKVATEKNDVYVGESNLEKPMVGETVSEKRDSDGGSLVISAEPGLIMRVVDGQTGEEPVDSYMETFSLAANARVDTNEHSPPHMIFELYSPVPGRTYEISLEAEPGEADVKSVDIRWFNDKQDQKLLLYRYLVEGEKETLLVQLSEDFEKISDLSEEDVRYLIEYPDYFPEELGFGHLVSVRSIDEIRSFYEEVMEDGSCIGVCQDYMDDLESLDLQFEILRRVSESADCQLSDGLKEEVRKKFILFDGAIGWKLDPESFYHDGLGVCGLKFWGMDSYDVDFDSYEYNVGFLVGDLIVQISMPLFPSGVLDEVDEMRGNLGFVDADGSTSCGSDCFDKVWVFMENLNYSDPVVQKVMGVYDQVVLSFRLN